MVRSKLMVKVFLAMLAMGNSTPKAVIVYPQGGNLGTRQIVGIRDNAIVLCKLGRAEFCFQLYKMASEGIVFPNSRRTPLYYLKRSCDLKFLSACDELRRFRK